MPTTKIGDQSVGYREQGEGFPAVLLVHGAGLSSLHFAELLNLMGQHGRRVVAIDLPGHGSSDPLEPPPSPPDLLEAYCGLVAELAEKLGLGRFVLAGHSMGGAVAQHFALTLGDRLESLVLIATSARLKVAPVLLDTIRNHFDHLGTLLGGVGFSSDTDRASVTRWCASQIQAPQEVVLADYLACAGFDLRSQVSNIACPTLVLSAADDVLTPPMLQEKLEHLIPSARLESITRAGHFMALERPDEVARHILSAAGVELPAADA